jgi:hypothetical protein
MSIQPGLEDFGGGAGGDRPHLTKEKPDGSSSRFDVEKDSEYWCKRCGHRITVSGEHEYGHARGKRGDMQLCPHHCHDGGLS